MVSIPGNGPATRHYQMLVLRALVLIIESILGNTDKSGLEKLATDIKNYIVMLERKRRIVT